MQDTSPLPFLNLEYLFNQVLVFFREIGGFLVQDISAFLPVIKVALSFLAVLFIVGIIYFIVRIIEISREEKEKYSFDGVMEEVLEGKNYKKWNYIVDKANSDNISDWKMAIIEADSILDEIVKKMGYDGDNLGERMKNIEVSDFNTLPQAWEAHKVRNRIAHDADFLLSEREARRVILLYQKVFEEFEWI